MTEKKCPFCGGEINTCVFVHYCKKCSVYFEQKVLDMVDEKNRRISFLEGKLNSAIVRMKVAIEDGEKAGLKLSPLRKFVEEYK